MKHLIRNGLFVLFIILLAGNIYLFVSGISLSDQINQFESGTKKLHQENLDLEAKVYNVESLQYAASMAASMDFTKKSQPLILDDMKYALNR